MNKQKLIETLSRNQLFSVVELLSRTLMLEREEFHEVVNDLFFDLPEEVLEYLFSLTNYEWLKLMQMIINALIYEAEKQDIKDLQARQQLEFTPSDNAKGD